MGYHLNRLDEPVFKAGPKPMRTEFGIHHGLENCEPNTYVNCRLWMDFEISTLACSLLGLIGASNNRALRQQPLPGKPKESSDGHSFQAFGQVEDFFKINSSNLFPHKAFKTPYNVLE